MKNRIILTAFILAAVPVWAWAAMGSASFKISTSVLSGGGGEMFSSSFSVHSVLGQPTPVSLQQDHPASGSYVLYPGYIYTLQSSCFGDFNGDGDVDGEDLHLFRVGYPGPINATDLGRFASEFGRLGCQ